MPTIFGMDETYWWLRSGGMQRQRRPLANRRFYCFSEWSSTAVFCFASEAGLILLGIGKAQSSCHMNRLFALLTYMLGQISAFHA